jgi:formate dehydrogenase
LFRIGIKECEANAIAQGGEHAQQEPNLLGTTENELGIRKWIEDQGHTLVTTSDKEGKDSKFDQELVDAEVIITTPYAPLRQLCVALL